MKRYREELNERKGGIGSAMFRLDVASANLKTSRENYLSAESRIVDADFAIETSRLVSRQILQQQGSALLAQANQSPALALQLLQT